nr:hypothetical protein VIGAN_06176900 [Ipomoea batatas]
MRMDLFTLQTTCLSCGMIMVGTRFLTLYMWINQLELVSAIVQMKMIFVTTKMVSVMISTISCRLSSRSTLNMSRMISS